MLVRRLQQWLTSLLSRLAPPRPSRQQTGAERQAVLVGAHSQAASAGGHADVNWLADARRLRPRLARRAPDPPREPQETAQPAYDAFGRPMRISRQRATDGQSDASGAPAATTPATSPPMMAPGPQTPAVAPPSEPLIASVSFESGPDESDTQVRRGLASLKYLVRLGIYNEGFKGKQVPEQYQHSLGMDDSSHDE